MKKSRLFNLALLLVGVLCVQTSRAQDDNPFSLPEGTRARLGKGAINGWWSPVAYSSDGTRLAVASDLGIWLYDAHTGTELALLTDHATRISSVAFAPDGKTIASAGGGGGGKIWFWDVETATLRGRTFWGHSVVFAPDGKTIASADGETVPLWDADSETLKNTLRGHTHEVTSVAFSPDGQTLASASYDQTIRLWDVKSETLKNTLQGVYLSVVFSPDGKTLASAGLDRTIRLWDADSETLKNTLRGHADEVLSVAFAPDGKTIASASYDRTIRLWDVESATLKNTLEGHTHEVTSVAFSPDGKTLASAGYDRTVRLWDADSGNLQNTLQGHMGIVSSVAFAPDGKTLASGSEDGTVLLWDMSPYITPAEPTAVQASSASLPTQTALLANFPNPFNPDTYIPYQLHVPTQVRLSIYDIRGALIREINLGYRAAGQYLTSANAAYWDGRDHLGAHVASGVYLYRLQAGPVAHVRKMVLVK